MASLATMANAVKVIAFRHSQVAFAAIQMR